MDRRSFLAALGAAPLAALVPWRPPTVLRVDLARIGDNSSVWLTVWDQGRVCGIFPAQGLGRFVRSYYLRETLLGLERSDDRTTWKRVPVENRRGVVYGATTR